MFSIESNGTKHNVRLKFGLILLRYVDISFILIHTWSSTCIFLMKTANINNYVHHNYKSHVKTKAYYSGNWLHVLLQTAIIHNTVHLLMYGAVSKVNKKFISQLTRANLHHQQRQLSKIHMRCQQFAFSCVLRGRGVGLQDGTAAGKGFLCAPFWGIQICDYSAAWVSRTVITDLDTSKRSTQKAFSCCDAIL